MDKWTDQAREEMVMDPSVQDKKIYPESGAMTRVVESRLIYGDISRVVTKAISQVPMLKYLQGRIRYWTKDIFNLID